VSVLKLNLIVIAVVVAMTGAFVFSLLKPGLSMFEQRRADLAHEIAMAEAAQRKLGNVGDLYASLMEMDEKVADFRKRLPAERQFGEFLNGISENLKRSRINGYSVQPGPAVHLDESRLEASMPLAKGAIVLPVSISFEGRFTKLFGFLERMAAMPRLSHVASISVANDESQPGQMSVEMTLHTYYQPDY
jgi:Tfp pilus assembly protein PilO